MTATTNSAINAGGLWLTRSALMRNTISFEVAMRIGWEAGSFYACFAKPQ